MSTTWAEQPLEQLLQQRLRTLPGTSGSDLYGDYTTARKSVLEDIVEHIDRSEPNLTDHGPRHLGDVMDRAYQLLNLGPNDLSSEELYILCVSILFHDVGNLHGRTDHHKKIGNIYKHVRGTDTRFLSERNAIMAVAGAHTGTTLDGSRDTLRSLDKLIFQGHTVRVREIASILRLADELAEGRHRTSAYLTNIGSYSVDSEVYHAYASIAEYAVQHGPPGRIAMTFTLDISHGPSGLLVHGVDLQSLLKLCYKRIIKLDQERRFCKYYCPFLRGLAETGAWFNFYYEGQQLPLDLHPLVISDLVVPGDATNEVAVLDEGYDLAKLLPVISSLCSGGSSAMTKYTNPFEYEQATTLPRKFVNEVFIENHSFTRFIQSTRNVLLIGERGSGKSMTLLYNSLSFREKQQPSIEPDSTDYIGIYVACNTALTHKREWELLEDKTLPQIVSEHFMVLAIAHAIAHELLGSSTTYPLDNDSQFREELEYVLGQELKKDAPALKAFMLFLERESYRSQIALNALKNEEFRMTAFTFSSLVYPLLLALRRTETLRSAHFLLLLDDAHDLNPFQKRTLNALLAYRDRSAFSLKVAVADLQSYNFSTVSGGTILEGHDFLVVDLQKPFQSPGSDFGKMAREVIERRLRVLGLNSSAEDFFPPSAEFEADMAYYRESVQREAEIAYPDEADAKKRRDHVYKYARVKYFQNRDPKSNLPPYAGIDTISHLSTGVIRNLLMPCYWMYDAVYSENESASGAAVKVIPADVQSKVILDRSTRLWEWMQHSLASSIDNCTLEDAKRVYQIFDQLGVLFRQRLLMEISEPRAIAFSISGWSEELESVLRPLLDIARRAQLLYLRNGPAKDEGRRETYYVPNRLLWPIRGLDVVGQHARVSLKARDLWAAANGSPFKSEQAPVLQGGLFDE